MSCECLYVTVYPYHASGLKVDFPYAPPTSRWIAPPPLEAEFPMKVQASKYGGTTDCELYCAAVSVQ